MNREMTRPHIVISDAEKAELYKLARSAAKKHPIVVGELIAELERAELCPARNVPFNVVRMYSDVRFLLDRGTEHAVQLVYPEDADIIRDRLSILSPIGTALIGLSEGQVMTWTDRSGEKRWLKVLEVHHASAL